MKTFENFSGLLDNTFNSEKINLTDKVTGKLASLMGSFEQTIIETEKDELQKAGIVSFFEEKLINKIEEV